MSVRGALSKVFFPSQNIEQESEIASVWFTRIVSDEKLILSILTIFGFDVLIFNLIFVVRKFVNI